MPQTPSFGFGPIPWWVWNGTMKYAEIERQLVLMKDAGMEGWTLWARFGLEMEYLSHDFMQRFRFAVQKSAELGLDVWVFDEFAWPTCSAKGSVQEVDPAYRMRVLSCFSTDAQGPGDVAFSPDWGKTGMAAAPVNARPGGGETTFSDEGDRLTPITPYLYPETIEEGNRVFFEPRVERVLAVPLEEGRMQIGQALDITDSCDDLSLNWSAPEGSWRILMLISRDFGLNIDVLNPEAVQCFLDVTCEKYKKYVGEFFGTTFKGFFSDETRMIRNTQHRFTEPTVAFSLNMFERLEERGIENLNECLAAAFADEDSPRIHECRWAYWNRVTELYGESFYDQLREWADRNGVIYTGDCFSEESGIIPQMGDYFRMARPYHMPGLDALCAPKQQGRESFKSPKFASSVAHQNEGPVAGRVLCEGPGLLGWGTTIEEMKHVTDWMYVFGVNILVPNAMHYTIGHDQLYETPSYFFQSTLWPLYPAWDRYTANLGRELTRGRHVAPVAYYFPTETLLPLFRPMKPMTKSMRYEGDMREVFPIVTYTAHDMIRRQIDYDYIDYAGMQRAAVNKGNLELAGESFSLVLVPATKIIARESAAKIREFGDAGGKVLWIRPLPDQYEDGESAQDLVEWVEGAGDACTVLDGIPDEHLDQIGHLIDSGQDPLPKGYSDTVESAIAGMIELPIRLRSDQRNEFAVYYRDDGDDQLLFVVYFGDETVSANLEIAGWDGAELVDVLRDKRSPVEGSKGKFQLEFAPYESKLLAGTSKPGSSPAASSSRILDGEWTVSMPDHNLVIPEPVTIETEWIDRRAWEAFVIYHERFTLNLEQAVDTLVWVMDETQHYRELERMKVFVNGHEAKLLDSPVVDPSLPAADLAPHLRPGENRIELALEHTDYMNARDLFWKRRAPAPVVRPRIFGKFVVNDGKLAQMPESFTVSTGDDLADKGYGLYSGRSVYKKTLNLEQPAVLRTIEFDDLANHAVVSIDGTEVGRALWRPWKIDCDHSLSAGDHTIEIEVTNTQANQMFEEPRPFGLLGPVTLALDIRN